jgi:ABC-2 type transport system ATP-binding protein
MVSRKDFKKDVKLEASGLEKSFGSNKVLDSVSFSVRGGEVFGLLGPNGAGKTTMIRIILDVLKQEAGTVRLFGLESGGSGGGPGGGSGDNDGSRAEEIKDRIGYLPEEGSLYKDSTVGEVIAYFARLKNCDLDENRLDEWLGRFDLIEHRSKKISELSKGMQRKVLFIIAVVHEPEVLILDEPFSGLDPVNRKLVKDIILDLKKKGMTIIMSTHQMDEVERMCDRILMIDKGRSVLYGGLNDIKKRFGFSVFVNYKGKLPKLAGVRKLDDYGSHAELVLKKGTDTQSLMRKLAGSKAEITRFDVKTRSLSEIFISIVKDGKGVLE